MGHITIIFDVGQYSTKIGFAGENAPRQTFYTVTGVPKYQSLDMRSARDKTIYVGNEVTEAMGLFKISFPIENGQITDWPMFRSLITYSLNQLGVDATVCNVLFCIHPLTSRETKERLFKLFLDEIQVRGFYIVVDVLLTRYSGGFNTGLVIDMGAASTRIAPVYEYYILDQAFTIYDLGGKGVTDYFTQLLKGVGVNVGSSVQREIVRLLKEKACFTSLQYEEDLKQPEKYSKTYSLPDGNQIELSDIRFKVPELYFKPDEFNLELSPLPKMICDVVDACDIDIRRDLLYNIFLCGGASLFPQFPQRLSEEISMELSARGKEMQDVRILAPKNRNNSTWIGASILAIIPEFADAFVTRAQYFSEGIPEELLE